MPNECDDTKRGMAVRLGSMLLRLRLASGITQAQVATAMGVTKMTISNWEAGKFVPSALQLVELADFFRVSLEVFHPITVAPNGV